MAVEEKVREEANAPQVAEVGSDSADAETLRQEIALHAYYKYCERGCGSGCDVDDWLAAEREVLAAHANPADASPPASADDDRDRRQSRSRR